MKPGVYVETSVLGYLTSWPSGDLVVAGRQKITRDWWQYALNAFELVVSEQYLVTWNFKHIANASMRSRIHGVCIEEGYDPCMICTPEELLEPESDV